MEEVWAARGRGPPEDGGQAAPRWLLSGGHPSVPSSPVKWTVYFHPIGAWACRPVWPDGSCQPTAADSWPWPLLVAWVPRTIGTVCTGSQLTLPSQASLCDPQTPPLAVPSLLCCLEAAACMGDVPGVWGVREGKQ